MFKNVETSLNDNCDQLLNHLGELENGNVTLKRSEGLKEMIADLLEVSTMGMQRTHTDCYSEECNRGSVNIGFA